MAFQQMHRFDTDKGELYTVSWQPDPLRRMVYDEQWSDLAAVSVDPQPTRAMHAAQTPATNVASLPDRSLKLTRPSATSMATIANGMNMPPMPQLIGQ